MASIIKRSDGKWRARYRDAAGKEHAKHFSRKADATRWLDEVTAAVVTGAYVDPKAGKVTVRDYGEAWRAMQPHRASTRELVERQLRLYVYPALGDRSVASVRPSDVQAFVSGLGRQLQPDTVRVVYSRLVGIFAAAARDRVIAISPCDRIALPERRRRAVEPLSGEAIWAVAGAIPGRYSALVVAAAGLGLRHGELTGLTVDRVDFLRHRVTVDQQLVTISHRPPYLGPVKSTKSRRVVPLPDVVANALAEHIRQYPPGEQGLIFTTEAGRPLHRATVSQMWSKAVRLAGLPAGTRLHDYADLRLMPTSAADRLARGGSGRRWVGIFRGSPGTQAVHRVACSGLA